MPFNPFEFREGMEAIPEGVMNDLENEVARLSKLHAIPPLVLRNDGTGPAIGIKLPRDDRIARTGAGGVPARAGAVLGRAAITFQDIKQTGTGATITGTLADAGSDFAYNLSGTAVGANRYVVVKRMEGLWVVVAEDCA
jgi:hypothetical protein